MLRRIWEGMKVLNQVFLTLFGVVLLANLRQRAGLSKAALARRVKTSQQQICRLESPRYSGHSMRMLRRVAKALNAHVRVVLEPDTKAEHAVKGRI
jgi:transcriptional regulator with XRE-family HTH domain